MDGQWIELLWKGGVVTSPTLYKGFYTVEMRDRNQVRCGIRTYSFRRWFIWTMVIWHVSGVIVTKESKKSSNTLPRPLNLLFARAILPTGEINDMHTCSFCSKRSQNEVHTLILSFCVILGLWLNYIRCRKKIHTKMLKPYQEWRWCS